MSKKSAPKPTPPRETAKAQTGTNITTATANSIMNNVNETTPYGSTEFNQSGFQWIKDPYTGKNYKVPKFSRTTTLSPQQQAISDQLEGAQLNLGTLGNNLSGQLKNQLTENFTLDNKSTESRLFDLQRSQYEPLLKDQTSDLQAQLSNQGIKLGSSAYDRAMRNNSDAQGRQWNDLLLRGRAQASQEQLTEDNQRINQIGALLSQGQVTQPNFMGSQGSTMPTPDVAGMIANNDAAKTRNWEQRNATTQNVLGGLFGLGANIMSVSDERAKTKMKPIGEIKGHKVYEYKLKGKFDDGRTHIGVSAQEAEKKNPDAVKMASDGFRRVEYGKLFGVGEAT